MAYTTINKSTDYFNTKFYTGNGGTNAITGVGFQPDWVWIKNRSSSQDHQVYDAIRGVNKKLETNTTTAEATLGGGLQAFGTDGFTLGDHSESNDNGDSYVSWNWKANGAGSSNSDGSITSTVSANTTAGFSVVSYTGTGSGATVGHGLGTIPKAYFIKNRASADWICYFEAIGNTKFLQLNLTNAAGTASAAFNDTSPTSSVFSVGSDTTSNASSNNYIAYVFAEKKGYSDFGTYTGNGNADGTFVYTGFKPAWIMTKRTDNTSSWIMRDNKRDAFNPSQTSLYANANTADDTSGGASYYIDFLSNGFKFTGNGTGFNASGGTYIYMAFAAAPLVGSNNVPATAR